MIQDTRLTQEQAKAHWSTIVHEGIVQVLTQTGAYHADDLHHLGIPDEHRNIIGSQTAKLVNKGWMEEAGRRKSIHPSRNGAKSGIYRLTSTGRATLVGSRAEGRGRACGDSSPDNGGPANAAPSPASGEKSSEGALSSSPSPSEDSPETLFELPERPSYVDPDFYEAA